MKHLTTIVALNLILAIVTTNGFSSETKTTPSSTIEGVDLGQVHFTAQEQKSICCYRQLLEALAARNLVPYELALGLATENEAKPYHQQITVSGWKNGQPILKNHDAK